MRSWAPDAYEGASAPVTAYMATIIKAGVLLAALRVFDTAPVVLPVAGSVTGRVAPLKAASGAPATQCCAWTRSATTPCGVSAVTDLSKSFRKRITK